MSDASPPPESPVPPNWVQVRYTNGASIETFTDVTSYTEVKDDNGAVVQVTFFGKLTGGSGVTEYHIIGVGAGVRVSSKTVV